MGYYINPPDMSKEEFLRTHMRRTEDIYFADEVWAKLAPDEIPVVLIDNGPFTAAGIAFNEDEFNAFTDPNDDRPRVIVIMPKDVLQPYYDFAREE